MRLGAWISVQCDEISILVRTRGQLKIKNQAVKIAHKDVGLNKQHMKSLIITLG